MLKKKLKLKERLSAYEKALAFYSVPQSSPIYSYSFCLHFEKLGISFPKALPELAAQKPEVTHGFWWWDPRNREIRVDALKNAITLAKEKLALKTVVKMLRRMEKDCSTTHIGITIYPDKSGHIKTVAGKVREKKVPFFKIKSIHEAGAKLLKDIE